MLRRARFCLQRPAYGKLTTQGFHSLSAADVDGDGRQQVVHGMAMRAARTGEVRFGWYSGRHIGFYLASDTDWSRLPLR